jgi:hypothetical protein
MEDSFETEKEHETKKCQRHCDKCDFTCNQTSSWLKHVSTAKHIQTQSKNKKAPNVCLCGKQYFDRSGLWKHTKKCMFILETVESVETVETVETVESVETVETVESVESVVTQDLIQELIAENKDLKLLVLKLVQKLCL